MTINGATLSILLLSISVIRGEEEILFFDDFSGTSLDRSKWNVEVSGRVFNNEQQAYIDSDQTLYFVSGEEAKGAQHGALAIQPRFAPNTKTTRNQSYDFVSARINTKDKAAFLYGTIAARIRLPQGSGLWPAFWMLGNGPWPTTGEIDIMEYVGEPDWIGVAVHGPKYSGETPLANRHYFETTTTRADEWHVYSVDWSRDALVFKVDDRVIYRVTRTMVEHYGDWVFDKPQHLLLNFALGGGYPLKNNGIKSPYFGLPAVTVDKIKANEVRLFVDWVKVTK